jgi:type IV secretory pathway TraG/TraD family ATPase VirD4
MTSGRIPPFLLLIALAAVALAPLPWLIPAMAGVAVAMGVFRGARSVGRMVGPMSTASTVGGGVQTPIVIGSDRRGRPAEIAESELGAHALVVGASGAGKTTTLLAIINELIARGRPVVAIDMKGSPSFAQAMAQAAASAGRPFRIWSPDGPNRWNPLRHGNATELKDKLISTERFTEPHYQRAAERYVQTVLQVLHEAQPERAATLSAVVETMDPQRLRAALRSHSPALRDRVQDYLAGLTPDQLSAIRGLQTRLAILTESHTGEFLDPGGQRNRARGAGDGEIDLRAALSGDQIVLFSLNSSTYGKLAAQLGTLAIQDLVCGAGSRLAGQAPGTKPPQAYVVIDEASVLGDHMLSLFARGREAGVGVLVATQELADFDRAAPGLRDQVVGNTAVKLVHRQEVPSSAQTIAQLAGTERVWEDVRQLGGPFLAGYRGGGGTRRRTEQFIVDPNEIKALHTGDAVLISKLRGERARTIRVRRPETSWARGSDPGQTRSSPMEAGGRSGPELG